MNSEHAVIVDQAHPPKFVHKMSDARPRCTHHLRQGFVAHGGYLLIVCWIVIVHASKLQKDSRKTLLAVIEQLIGKVRFEINVSSQKGRSELLGKPSLITKRPEHCALLDVEHSGWFPSEYSLQFKAIVLGAKIEFEAKLIQQDASAALLRSPSSCLSNSNTYVTIRRSYWRKIFFKFWNMWTPPANRHMQSGSIG